MLISNNYTQFLQFSFIDGQKNNENTIIIEIIAHPYIGDSYTQH